MQFFQTRVTFDEVDIRISSGRKTETMIIAEIAGVVWHIVVAEAADQTLVGTVTGTHVLAQEVTAIMAVIGLLAGV